MTTYGDLMDYDSGSYIREATKAERDASRSAANIDGGAGVILVDGNDAVLSADDRGADDARRCYVQADTLFEHAPGHVECTGERPPEL